MGDDRRRRRRGSDEVGIWVIEHLLLLLLPAARRRQRGRDEGAAADGRGAMAARRPTGLRPGSLLRRGRSAGLALEARGCGSEGIGRDAGEAAGTGNERERCGSRGERGIEGEKWIGRRVSAALSLRDVAREGDGDRAGGSPLALGLARERGWAGLRSPGGPT